MAINPFVDDDLSQLSFAQFRDDQVVACPEQDYVKDKVECACSLIEVEFIWQVLLALMRSKSHTSSTFDFFWTIVLMKVIPEPLLLSDGFPLFIKSESLQIPTENCVSNVVGSMKRVGIS